MRHGDVQILNMKVTFPVILCVLGAISWFWMSLWLRSFKVRSRRALCSPFFGTEATEDSNRKLDRFWWGLRFVVGAILDRMASTYRRPLR